MFDLLITDTRKEKDTCSNFKFFILLLSFAMQNFFMFNLVITDN